MRWADGSQTPIDPGDLPMANHHPLPSLAFAPMESGTSPAPKVGVLPLPAEVSTSTRAREDIHAHIKSRRHIFPNINLNVPVPVELSKIIHQSLASDLRSGSRYSRGKINLVMIEIVNVDRLVLLIDRPPIAQPST